MGSSSQRITDSGDGTGAGAASCTGAAAGAAGGWSCVSAVPGRSGSGTVVPGSCGAVGAGGLIQCRSRWYG